MRRFSLVCVVGVLVGCGGDDGGGENPSDAAGSDTATSDAPLDGGSDARTDEGIDGALDAADGSTDTTPPPSIRFTDEAKLSLGSGQRLGLVLAPLGADDLPDVAVTDSIASTVSILEDTTPRDATTPTFAPATSFPTSDGPTWVAAADLDGDGKLDLAFSTGSDNVSVLLNSTATGPASFRTKVDFPTGEPGCATCTPTDGGTSIAIGDVDGDKKVDIVVTNAHSETVSVLSNRTTTPGTPVFAPKVDFPVGKKPQIVAITDLDGDDKNDLAVGCDGVVSILTNTTTSPTTPTFAPKVDLTVPKGTLRVALAIVDLDGDGRNDIATVPFAPTEGKLSILMNTTAPGVTPATFAAPASFAAGARSTSLAVGDLDGDGKRDLAVASDKVIAIFPNTTKKGAATPTFAARVDVTCAPGGQALRLGDLNGDRKLDLVLTSDAASGTSVAASLSVFLAR
jgi:hypothetical protein